MVIWVQQSQQGGMHCDKQNCFGDSKTLLDFKGGPLIYLFPTNFTLSALPQPQFTETLEMSISIKLLSIPKLNEKRGKKTTMPQSKVPSCFFGNKLVLMANYSIFLHRAKIFCNSGVTFSFRQAQGRLMGEGFILLTRGYGFMGGGIPPPF